MTRKSNARFVFINCPLDRRFTRIRLAITFAIMDCGFTPRIAIESNDGGQVRIAKILEIIRDCELGIHDLTRVQLDPINRLPRFNMAFELGLFLGAKHFGGPSHAGKRSLIFERRKYELQKCLSDTAGQDLDTHNSKTQSVIRKVRDWLSDNDNYKTYSGAKMSSRFEEFSSWIGKEAKRSGFTVVEMPFNEYCAYVQNWLLGEQESGKLKNLRIAK